jgi:two-component system, NarL family, response regulator NreC
VSLYREKILFADEDELFCEGLLRHFKSQNSFDVVDVASDWSEVVSKAEKLTPDIVVMSIRIMHSDWIRASRLIRQKLPFTTIIVLSENRQNLKEGLRAGVNAFIAKDLPFRDILRIIGTVNESSSFVFPGDDSGPQREAEPGKPKEPILSKREKEILVLVAKGFQNKEIANRLSIHIPTVNNHLYSIFRKLGSSNRTEAVLTAAKRKVIDIDT